MSKLELHHILTASAGGSWPKVCTDGFGPLEIEEINGEQVALRSLETDDFGTERISDCKLVLRKLEDLTPEEMSKAILDTSGEVIIDCHAIFGRGGVVEWYGYSEQHGQGLIMTEEDIKNDLLIPRIYRALAALRADLWGFIDKGIAVREKDIQQEGGKL